MTIVRSLFSKLPLLFWKSTFLAVAFLSGCDGDGGTPVPILIPPLRPTFTISGSVTGLTGTGLVLQNGGNNLSISSGNSNFTFTTAIASGSPYSVSVFTQPRSPGQTCTVANATGTMGSANIANITVSCVLNTFTTGSDPLFANQWHLKNTGQDGGTVGEDVNVVPVWNSNIMGAGVRIAIVDDGLEIAHEDISPNVVLGQSYNYVNGTTNPTGSDPSHGTAVGGVAAARDSNGLGVAGAAPRAGLVGYNPLEIHTSANEADAMTRNAAAVSISNNSWGANDDTGGYNASDATWRTAINTGLTTGRNGKGIVYTWAAGNGGEGAGSLHVDNSNYDGQANYRGVLAICAVGDDGVRASYSERGANLWVCTPSEGRGGHGITTTDRTGTAGYNPDPTNSGDYSNRNYTNTFSGTSSATPLASGMIALVLEANPNLTWRDLRIILAQSARKNDPFDPDWVVNGGGFNVNHNYGFGVANANAAVELANPNTWMNIGPEITFATPTATVNTPIPDDGGTATSSTIAVAGSGVGKIESVEIVFNTNHPYVGDLDITLTAPFGTVSRLNEPHTCEGGECSLPGGTWRYSSARHLGEAANGPWTLTVKDMATGDTGTFTSWQMTFYGRAN